MNLTAPPVHENQIWKAGEPAEREIHILLVQFPNLGEGVPKAAAEHFCHAGIVVGPLYSLYPKFSIVSIFGFSPLKNHHGANGLEAKGIGDIIGFNTLVGFV